ncbi:MAG: hypothetical protein HQL63_10235 [Magnetococcales bacterium]|nr:hypothetical protein [Magnetococcales bacterium]
MNNQYRTLFVLAGIPNDNNIISKFNLKKNYNTEFMWCNALKIGNKLSYDEKKIDKTIENIYKKVLDSESYSALPPINQIYLVFQKVKKWEYLLDKCRFFSFPVSTSKPAISIDKIIKEYKEIINKLSDGQNDFLKIIKNVIPYTHSRVGKNYLNYYFVMLPTLNFNNANTEHFFATFEGVAPVLKNMPRFAPEQKGFIDDLKGIFRPESAPESHPVPDLEKLAPHHRLNAMFRFGLRYDSRFHFDLAKPDGRNQYFCLERERVVKQPDGTKPYANIYPSDLIRWKTEAGTASWCAATN